MRVSIVAVLLLFTGCVIDGDAREVRGYATCDSSDDMPVFPALVELLDTNDDGCDWGGCFESDADTLGYSELDADGRFSFIAIVPHEVTEPTIKVVPDDGLLCGNGYNIGMAALPEDDSEVHIVISPFQI